MPIVVPTIANCGGTIKVTAGETVVVHGGDYSTLDNKPLIGGKVLVGNRSLEGLGIAPIDHTHEISDVDQLAEAISGKISEPASEGVSGQVLTTDGAGGRTWTTVQGGGGGTSDYNALSNRPQVNGVTLSGNKSAADLSLAASTHSHAESDITGLVADLSGKASSVHTHAESDITNLVSDLASKVTEPVSEGTSGQVLTTDGAGGRAWTTVQGGGGTSDYNSLTNKPSVNSVTLSGNKSLADIGAAAASHTHTEAEVTGLVSDLAGKQESLVSGTNIKTLNGKSLLGSGNIQADLMWENASTSSTMAANTVWQPTYGSIDDYTAFLIICKLSTDTATKSSAVIANGEYSSVMMRSTSASTIYMRGFTFDTNGFKAATSGYSGTTAGDKYVIPLKIYGLM